MGTYDILLSTSKPTNPTPSDEGSSSRNDKSVQQRHKPLTQEHMAVTSKQISSVKPKKDLNENIVPSVVPNERTVKPNGQTERFSIIHELEEGVNEPEQRRTERYSFEIYVDQLGKIEDLQYRYKKRTGKKLSSSRIIREALDEYLKQAE